MNYFPSSKRAMQRDFQCRVLIYVFLAVYSLFVKFNNADSINVFVEILSFVNFSFAVYNGDRRQLGAPDYFGDSLYFFNSTGGFLGSIGSQEWRPFRDGKPDSSGNQKGNGRQLADETQGFTTVTVSPTYLPSNGGIICLEGTDGGQPFYRTTGYGDAIAQIIDTTPCSGKGIDEHVADSTSLIPGEGESYQRVGEGYRPEDFTWKVLPITPNNVNVDQEFNFTKPPSNPPTPSPSAPVCPEENECNSGSFGRGSFFFGSSPRYNIYKNRRLFGTCSTRCAARFWVRVLRVFGWRCGTCESS